MIYLMEQTKPKAYEILGGINFFVCVGRRFSLDIIGKQGDVSTHWMDFCPSGGIADGMVPIPKGPLALHRCTVQNGDKSILWNSG